MKKGPKDLKAGLPPLKELKRDTRLPSFFDLMWDIKWGYQVYEDLFGILQKVEFYEALAEHGFDAENVRKYAKSRNSLHFNEQTKCHF